MKKTCLLLMTLFTFLTSFNCYAGNLSFADISKQILDISFIPKKEIDTTKILVLHPMVKDKLTELMYTYKILSKDGKWVRTIESFKQLQGKPVKGKVELGGSFDLLYIPQDLRDLCSCGDITGWKEDKTTLKLDKKSLPGYRFVATMGNEKKECSVFTNEKGGLKAITMGFDGGKLKVDNNSSKSSMTWYFGKKDGKLMLEKSTKVTAEKKNGVPFIKTETKVYK